MSDQEFDHIFSDRELEEMLYLMEKNPVSTSLPFLAGTSPGLQFQPHFPDHAFDLLSLSTTPSLSGEAHSGASGEGGGGVRVKEESSEAFILPSTSGNGVGPHSLFPELSARTGAASLTRPVKADKAKAQPAGGARRGVRRC